MGRPMADQRQTTVGASSTQILGPSSRRRGIVVSVPPGNTILGNSGTVLVAAVSTAATGVVATYTVPAGAQAALTSAAFRLIGGTPPTVALQVVRGATTVSLITLTATGQWTGSIPLQPGDVVQWNVTVGGATSTADFAIGILLDNSIGRVTLSFLRPAVLDAGINVYPGTSPLVLNDERIGGAFQEGLFAIAPQAGNQIVIWDIADG